MFYSCSGTNENGETTARHCAEMCLNVHRSLFYIIFQILLHSQEAVLWLQGFVASLNNVSGSISFQLLRVSSTNREEAGFMTVLQPATMGRSGGFGPSFWELS